MIRRCTWMVLAAVGVAVAAGAGTLPPAEAVAQNTPRGLVALVGGETDEAIALGDALDARDGCIVQCLDSEAQRIDSLRAGIAAKGLGGKVTVRRFDGEHLPYSDQLVNGLIVGQGGKALAGGEIERVLAPRGAVWIDNRVRAALDVGNLVKSEATVEGWTCFTKPWPAGLDSWSHYLYDASGSAVSRDTAIGHPRHVQWEAPPRWSRSHENMSSITAVVSTGGRVFSIVDEGPTASIYLPPEVALVARDAFNGILLWRRPIPKWHSHLFRLKSGPHQLARRLAATEEEVYVTLGIGAPVSVLQAATGKIARVIPGSERTEEILHAEGKLVLRIQQDSGDTSSVAAFDAHSGSMLWKADDRRWTPLTLSADSGRVYCHGVDRLYCMDMASGSIVWQTPVGKPVGPFRTNAGPGITVGNGVVVFASKQGVAALDASSGSQLWEHTGPISDYKSPTRVHVIDDLVWKVANRGWDVNDWSNAARKIDDVFIGFDVRTGEIKRRIGIDGSRGEGIIHHRCYIPKAVGKTILTSWPGIEFVDTAACTIAQHNWIRGACLYGILPANGMIYVPSHPCVCYNQGKLNGFYAVSSQETPIEAIASRLEQGPAYGSSHASRFTDHDSVWPTYRGNNSRSGCSQSALDESLAVQWQSRVGSSLTAPVVAGHMALVVDAAADTVHAVGVGDGKPRWRFVADGPIDSPPTIYGTSACFGCRDGYIYCLDTGTGALRWRFLAAKSDRQIVSYDRLESQWPSHGSVAIVDGKLYAVAGRNAFMDDGMDLYCLDPVTGKQLAVKSLGSLDAEGKQPKLTGRATDRLSTDSVAPDILSSDGQHLFLRHKTYRLDGLEETEGKPHLYSAMGFLDSDQFHRTFWAHDDGTVGQHYAWQFGGSRGKRGGTPTFGSHLAVTDDTHVYHFGRKKAIMSHHKVNEQFYLAAYPKVPGKGPRWMIPASIRIRAMALAGNRLYVAGVCGDWRSSHEAFTGAKGISLRVHDTGTGETVADYPLDAPPVFDGMAIAGGRLYLSLENGNLLCMR